MNDLQISDNNSQELISTGIPILDNILGGGLPAGSVVCFMADPMSMALSARLSSNALSAGKSQK